MTSRTILITGCGSGIGYHCAGALKRRGWQVFATCRRQADCDRLAAEGLETVRLDYSDPASIAAALDHVLAATGGRLDALFNNGGFSLPGAVEDLSADNMRAVLEANFIGWHDLTRRVIPVMRAQGAGRIVNCSSILGFVAQYASAAPTSPRNSPSRAGATRCGWSSAAPASASRSSSPDRSQATCWPTPATAS